LKKYLPVTVAPPVPSRSRVVRRASLACLWVCSWPPTHIGSGGVQSYAGRARRQRRRHKKNRPAWSGWAVSSFQSA